MPFLIHENIPQSPALSVMAECSKTLAQKMSQHPNHRELASPRSCDGRFYVSCECLDHDLSRSIAPMLFERDEKLGVYFVKKQPETSHELALMQKSIESCPVEAIRDRQEENQETLT